jgi:small-conductance mechanosensitive channel
MNEIKGFLDPTFFGNTLWQWTIAGAIALAVLAVLWFMRRLLRNQYNRLAATPQEELLETPLKVASRTTTLFILIVAIFAGLQAVALPPKLGKLALTIFTIAAFWQAGLWGSTAVLASLERRANREMAVNRAAAGTIGIIGFIARVTIWALVLMLTLSNLGIEIQPLLASLGIGGIAVALAAQNVLGDLFASLAITLDRPFIVGDALAVDNFSGTVEYIGVKSTRLRGTDGEQIIMPNANLMNSRMRNHSRLRERRVVFTISLSQETPTAKLATVAALLRSLIESQQDTRFDRAHFAKITATSFDFEAVYFVTTPDYGRYMDIQQTINLKLLEALESEGITFAYPTQTLRLDRGAGVESQLVDSSLPAAAQSSEPQKKPPKNP